jgi:hypothetical protein
MTSPSLAGYLASGPHAAAAADRDDLYLDASGNLVVRLANGTALTITPAGLLTVPGGAVAGGVDLVAAATAAPTQQLVSGGFEVLQRGAGPFTANLAYAHDRWQILLGGTSTISVTDETALVDTGSGHALKAVYVQGSAVSSIDQKVEQYLQLRGRTLTFAVRMRKGVASSGRVYIEDSGVRTYGTPTATTGAYETLSVTAPIGAAATAVHVGVELSASDTVYLDNATLGVGSAVQVYLPVDSALELARCMRYYQVLGGLDANEMIAIVQATTTTTALGPLRYPVPMAIAPTMTISAAGDFETLIPSGPAQAVTALTGASITARSMRLTVTVAANLAAGAASVLRAANVNARLILEANP